MLFFVFVEFLTKGRFDGCDCYAQGSADKRWMLPRLYIKVNDCAPIVSSARI